MASLGLFYDLREHYWARSHTRTEVVARHNNSHASRLVAGGYIALWLSMTVAQCNYVAQHSFVAQRSQWSGVEFLPVFYSRFAHQVVLGSRATKVNCFFQKPG